MAGLLKSLFSAPVYERYVVLGDSQKGPFWDCTNWTERLFPILDRVIAQVQGEASVHCRQVTGSLSKDVKFGRIGWSRDDSKKWCHSSEFPERKAWQFVDLQVFCPAKPVLIKTTELPTVYIQVKPMTRNDTETKTAYDEGVFIALRERFAWGGAAESMVSALTHVPGVVAIYKATAKVTQLNAFESLVREDFMYRGMLESEFPDVKKMRLKWVRVK
jgi:hypothetical protein